ncbi:thiamine-phosphate kinase [Agaribacter flavus]|uniref:Thiamine-monophosphate kinase n=1 Tax=Agaribacter flavus TaxID=1902781 RepID=A0ABV7FSF6_9ALTE
MNEFSLIKQYFQTSDNQRKDVLIGIGDDAAITQIPEGQLLATTTDTLLESVHFLKESQPSAIAHKAMAVNLSDLAAMGAEPAWINLSLSIPKADEIWLRAFSDKIKELTEYFSVQLIGGDTVKGSLAITITAQGFVPSDSTLTRSSAKPGDWVFVTGTLGDASAGLDILLGKLEAADPTHKHALVNRHYFPTPRILAGQTLRRLASSCIDVSDGLLQDMQHIVEASGVGVILHLDRLPISRALGSTVPHLDQALGYACTGGDDYELLFTVPEVHRVSVESAMASYNIPCTCIGQVTGANGKVDLRLDDKEYELPETLQRGYQHF